MNLSRAIGRSGGVLVVVGGVAICVSMVLFGSAHGDDAQPKAAPKPVDESMHHFMEYVFEPNYKRLKAAMSEAPKSKADWKAVKGDSLTLAEGANLLLLRAPEENGDDWRRLSVEVRQHGGALYQAARKSDYDSAHKAYVNMLHNCNACHKQFADGKHQLKP